MPEGNRACSNLSVKRYFGQLIEMYDIKMAADIQEALKDLLGGTNQSMLEAELEEQMEVRE